MVIKIKLKETALKKGIKTAYQFQKVTGFAPAMAARIYKSNWKRLDIATLNQICQSLDCELVDILELTKDQDLP